MPSQLQCRLMKMCHGFKIFLILIVIFGSQCKNVGNSRKVRYTVRQDEDDGKSSLVFVFDTTGSMYNDLKQLREGAELILNTALEESDVIGDFVFVPFHDPVVGPPTVTRDKHVFQSALNIVRVYGGGDCPEKALTGIQLALDVSRARSFVYVFTDATAADHRLVGKVLDQVQRKQSQVVFVLTGHCNDLHRPSYKVYQQIAAASSGQVFNLNKTSVHKVLDFVRSSIKGRSVNLGSVVQTAGHNYTQGIPVDSTLSEVTVSVSGAKPQIRVVNPSGEVVTGPPQLVTTLDLSEIMVVKVLEPEAGNWTITVVSEDDYSVKVVGMSNLTFTHGFSVTPPRDVREASYRPLKGTYNHMVISLTQTDAPVDINHAQIVSLDGKTLFEVPLKRFKDNGIYIADAFVPPEDFFYIAIGGKDHLNQELRRIGATAVQVKLPDIPYITTPLAIVSRTHDRVTLKCFIESLVPVTAFWTKDMAKVQPQISALQSTSIEYVIEDMSEERVGSYKCVAKNVAGVGSADTELTLAVDPPLVSIAPENTTVSVGDNITIYCAIYTEAFLKKFQLVHSGNGSPSKYYNIMVEPSIDGVYSFNKTIIHINETDGGTYSCVAANRATDALELKTLIKPTAHIEGSRNMTIEFGSCAQLTCVVQARPEPRILWHRETEHFLNHTIQIIAPDTYKSVLKLNSSREIVDGMYFCYGENSEGIAHDNATVRMRREMVALRKFEDILVPPYTKIELHCVIDSYPPASIAWYKDHKMIIGDQNVKISNRSLTILRVNFDDQGIYTCEAINDYEAMKIDGNLKILVCPEISKETETLIVLKGQAAVIPCRLLQGHPTPNTTWQYKGLEGFGDLPPNSWANHTELTIYNVSVDMSGEYRCVAENLCGKDEFITTLVVHSPPELISPQTEEEEIINIVEVGGLVSLECKAGGTPRPTLTWMKDGRAVSYSTRVYLDTLDPYSSSHSIEHLVIEKARPHDSGLYTCNAASALGTVQKEFLLIVYEAPTIHNSLLSSQVTVNEGQFVELPCSARGHPKPEILWLHNGQPISDSRRSVDDTGIRFIANLTDFGTYTCIAKNEYANASLEFSLYVWVPPSIEPPLEDTKKVFVGENMTLQCNVVGFPLPSVMWEFNDVILTSNTTEFSFNEVGDMFISNATLKHEGRYVCIAENVAGIMMKIIWLNVYEPLKILPDNFHGPYIATNMDTALVIPCNVTGKPKPYIVWSKDDYYLNNDPRFVLDTDGSLTIKFPTEDLSGSYTCTAKSELGEVNRTVNVDIYSLATQMQSEESAKTVKIVEGQQGNIECPISMSPKDLVKWYKDARIVSRDRLRISNVTRQDSGVYACVVTNAVSSASASVQLVVEWSPIFIEDYKREVEAVKGEDHYFNCEVDARPAAKTKWLFNSRPMLFEERSKLKLLTVQMWHTGLYQCVVENSHGAVTRKFSLDVLEPPFISEFDLLDVQLKEGMSASLECDVRGTPPPKIKWTYNNTYWYTANSTLTTSEITANSSGLYRCEATNKAGSAHLVYRVNVVSPAKVEELVTYKDGVGTTVGETLNAVIGSRIRLSCIASGVPSPRIQWIRNGKQLAREEELSFLELVVENVQPTQSGGYSCVVGNLGGVSERKVSIEVLEPPTIFRTLFDNSTQSSVMVNLEVISGQAFYMHCHPYGNPWPQVYWFKDELPLRLFGGSMVATDNGEVIESRSAEYDQSGNYTCIARNALGNTSVSYLVDVLVPPPTPKENPKPVTVRAGKPLELSCPVEGSPLPYAKWIKHPYTELVNTSKLLLLHDNYTLLINKTEVADSGAYSCVLTNRVGTTEVVFSVVVEKPPRVHTDGQDNIVVGRGRSVLLKCEVDGHPQPKITWLKDIVQLSSSMSNIQQALGSSLLAIWNADVRDAGQYICVAENAAGSDHRRLNLAVQVPGKWSVWSKWDYCNVTCGLGYQHRSRVCQFLDDENNVFDKGTRPDKIIVDESACKGHGTDSRKCHMPSCEEGSGPRWSQWSQWSACSASCGAAIRTRTRRCRSKAVCYGDNVQISKCTDLPKCDNYDQLENEVYNKNDEETTSLSPYAPEATYEVEPKPDNDDVEYLRANTYTERHYPPPQYYAVDVSSSARSGACAAGYSHNVARGSCDDIDECTMESNRCHATQTCVNTLGGYKCGCPPGYNAHGVGSRCLDINECIQDIDGCEFACVNVAGGFVCACPGTLRLRADRRHCLEPSLYREPLALDQSESDDVYLSTSVDAPIKYTRIAD
ncbi:hemicentin-1-like isoform X2 [Plodia interpunctella]|uniref:hemicentin-1-like isoform X2 n=1 Tax=Plodia interpunctella TaxID=58824 RepID=UPI00236871E6|nr:hemicentin-1-like isoform X2 [Plodia interpunctella]